ncbi:MAG: hypothetical protein GY951_17685 [Psychromonas sp.]|nr:hypothetical protein [Candidatus Brocadiaceae bacterium]MCP5079870.1 hypothetical protein [Psychromonas sp.]
MTKEAIDLDAMVSTDASFHYLGTEKACVQYADSHNAPIPEADTFVIDKCNGFKPIRQGRMFSYGWDKLREKPVSGLMRGLQAFIDAVNPTDEKLYVITEKEFRTLIEAEK